MALFVAVKCCVKWRAATPDIMTAEEGRTVIRWFLIPGLAVLGGCAWVLLHFFRHSHNPLSQSTAPLVLSIIVGLLFCGYLAGQIWFSVSKPE
jgi:hypothetical protein